MLLAILASLASQTAAPGQERTRARELRADRPISRLNLPVAVQGAVLAPTPTPAPAVVQLLSEIGGPANDVAVLDHYALLAVGSALVVYDISRPSEPLEVGRSRPLGGMARGVAVLGHHALVAVSADFDESLDQVGVAVLDLANLAEPTLVRVLHFRGGATDVLVAGELAYVATSNPWLDGPGERFTPQIVVLNVSEPSRPRQLGAYPVAAASWRLGLSGTTLFYREGALDISDPANPAPTARPKAWPDDAYDMVTGPDWLAATVGGPDRASPNSVFLTYDATASPKPVACGSPERASMALAGFGEHLLVAGDQGGCVLWPASAEDPRPMAAFDLPGAATAAAVTGGYGVVALTTWGLYGGLGMVDVSRPLAPRALISLLRPSTGSVAAVAVGNRLYIVDGRLWSIEILPTGALRLLGSAAVQYEAYGLTADATHVYVAAGADIDVFDVHADGALNFLGRSNGHLEIGGRPTSLPVVRRGDYVYTAGSCLQTVDVRNPSAPVALGCDDAYWNLVPLEGDLAYAGAIYHAGQWQPVQPEPWQLVRLGQGPPVPVGSPWDLDAMAAVAGGTHLYAVMHTAFGSVDPHDLAVFDITKPLNPRRTAVLPRAIPATGHHLSEGKLALASHWLYFADYAGEVTVFDVSDPDAPVPATTFTGSDFQHALIDRRGAKATPFDPVPHFLRSVDLSTWGESVVFATNPGGVALLRVERTGKAGSRPP